MKKSLTVVEVIDAEIVDDEDDVYRRVHEVDMQMADEFVRRYLLGNKTDPKLSLLSNVLKPSLVYTIEKEK